MIEDCKGLKNLQGILDRLLGPEGCPWDQEQTPESLCDYVIEECYELVEGIRAHKPDEVREELGDVFFLLLFIAAIYKKRGKFTLCDALDENAAKMVHRHPHVFSDVSFADKEELLRNWERLKKEEKAAKAGEADAAKGIFDSLPKSLPPLIQAYRINAKAARAGFTWDSDADVEQQVEAEWLEWLEASQSLSERFKEVPAASSPASSASPVSPVSPVSSGAAPSVSPHLSDPSKPLPEPSNQVVSQTAGKDDECADEALSTDPVQAAMEEELGDLLFTIIELGRRKGIKANAALQRSNMKFLRRFSAMEELARKNGRDFAGLDIAAKEELWRQVKAAEKK